MATITTAGSGNWDAGATWTGGSVPGDGDTASIESGHTCTLTENEQVGAVVINGGTIAGGGFKITCVKTSGRLFDHSGTITGNLDVELQGTHTTTEDFMGTGNIRNLTLNGSGLNVDIGRATTIDGNLTITQGTLHTNASSNHALTVTGTTTVTGTLTCNASTVSLGSGKSDGYALLGSGTVNFGTGTITVGAVNTTSASGITKTSGTITFNTQKVGGQSIGPSVTSVNSHFNFGTSTVNFDLSGGFGSIFAVEQHSGSSKTFTITAGSVNYKSDGYIYQNNTDTNIFKIIGDLVIDASKTLKTYFDNADDFGSKLEVTGDVTSNGTLNAYSASNPKPMDFGSLTINSGGTYSATSGTTTITSEAGSGYAIEISGTYTPNAGTLKITTDANTLVKILDDVNHLIIEAATATRVYEWVNNTTVQGNLTINAGRFAHYSPNFSLDVQGDCTINNTGILDGGSGSIEMNSLTIGTGGEYRATTGTTTITGESGGGLAINNDGILTHNKGTVKVDMDSTTSLDLTGTGSVDFYNLIVDSDATVSYGASVIENNLTKKGAGRMRPNGDSGRNLEVKGTLLVEAGTFGRGANDTHTNTFGNVVITGGTIDLTGGGGSGKTIVKGAFRNLGGTVNSP